MAGNVGARGRVTIEKSIRDALGVGKGWIVLQRLVNGHIEMRFAPPEHDRSLKGALEHTEVSIPAEDWTDAREKAWADATREKREDSQT